MSNYFESDEALPVVFENGSDGGNGVTFSGLNPILGSAGVMVGLLKQPDPTLDTYELVNEWFADPIGNIKGGFEKNASSLGDLLGQLLGTLGGNALGIPQDDPALLGTWYPIQIKDDKGVYQPTGLFLVTIENPDGSTAIGLGVLKKWNIPVSSKAIDVDVWALVPAVVVDSNGFSLTFTDDHNINPITVGVAAQGADPKSPIIDENGITFNGLKLSANLFLSSNPRFDVTLEVLAMQLAGDPKPKNYSLADLEAITPQQIFETASNLFIGALSDQFSEEIQQKILYLAPLFGLSQSIPGNKDVKLPILQWYELFAIVSQKGDPTKPFIDWFNTITASPELMDGWMTCLSGFMSNTIGDIQVTGDGSRTTPYQVPLLVVDKIGTLNFTTASIVTDGGTRFFYPGLSFKGTPLALGTSDAEFRMEADLELGKFQLSGTPQVDFDINFRTNFKLKNKVDTSPLIDFQGYKVGTMAGGLSIGVGSGSIVPYLQLTDVTILGQSGGESTANPLGTVDLLSPGQLADVGSEILSAQLQDFMGLNDPNPSVFAVSIASLIGLTQPKTATDWPKDLSPPFSVDSMGESITDPINALAKYYQDTLNYTQLVDGKNAFTYMLQSFASLLQVGDTSTEINGAGTQQDPWKVGISIGEKTMPAYLTAYRQDINGDAANGFLFNLGFSFEPLLTIASVNIKPSLVIDALSLSFPKDKGTTASWFNSVGAQLALPDGFTTPGIGDAVLSVSEASISAGWGQLSGWTWSMLVEKPTLTIGSNKPIVGADLNFSEQSTLEDLVKDSAATFGPFFTNALGIFLMRTNTRPGFLTAATLGLLTDFSDFEIYKKSGLNWTGFTQLPLTSFDDPLGLLRQQIASNFDTPEKAKSQLSLLAWTLSSEEKAPEIAGAGTLTDPYLCPLPGGFELPVWYNSTTKVIGVGFGRNDNFSYPAEDPKLAVDILANLRFLEYNLQSGTIEDNDDAPSFSFQTIVSNPSGKLVDVTLPDGSSGSVDKVILGFDLNIVSGSIQFNPVVTLVQAKLFGETTAEDITLTQFLDGTFTEKAKSSFNSLLNSAIQKAIEYVKGQPLFQNAYKVLSYLGITLPVDLNMNDAGDDTNLFGINTSGWSALLANPQAYIEKQLLAFFKSPDNIQTLISVFESIFDVKVPKFPKIALDLFNGLQIVGPASDNYPLYPQAILEIVSNPVTSLKNRFEALFSNPDVLVALTKELTKNIPVEGFGMFEISSNSNGVVTLALPASNPFKFGDEDRPFLEISGSLSLDFSNKNLTVELDSYVPILGFTLSNSFSVGYNDTGVHLTPPLASLIWGDGKTPAAAPLQILPFDSKTFVDNVAQLAPAYALNIFISAVFEDQFLNDTAKSKASPVVRSIFELLGISKSEAGIWTMPSLLGIMEHPLDWLLSDEVLGIDGKFNIAKMTRMLAAFPTASYQPTADINITIAPNDEKSGIVISGLPYGFFAEFSGDSATGAARFNFGNKEVNIADGKAIIDDLNFCAHVSADYQTSFSGSAKLATNLVPVPFFAEVGFDKEFMLSVTQGTPAAPKLTLQVLPFTGWGKLAEAAATLVASEVIETVVPKILDALEPKAKTFVGALRTFGDKVPVGELITLLVPIATSGKSQAEILEELEKTSLAWLKGLFTGTQLPDTLTGIQAIFSAVPGVGDLTVEGGLLKFVPSDKLPVSLYFGVDENENLGLWAGLTIPAIPYINLGVERTGIGIDLATLSKVTFTFGVDIVIPVDEENGPGLYLNYVRDKGFTLIFDPQASVDDAAAHSSMSVQLFPDFFGNPQDLGQEVKKWLLQVIQNVLPRYISILVLNNETVLGWLQYNLFTSVSNTIKLTPLEILEATTLVVSEGKPPKTTYLLNTIDNIKKITPQLFLANFLNTLLKSEIQVYKFDSGGGIFIGPKEDGSEYLGVRLFAPDFKVDALPNIVLQLGAKDDQWIKDSSSDPIAAKPGIQFYVPVSTTPSIDIDFSNFNIVLGNVGFDIVGEKGKPVVDLSRFKLGAIDPRIFLDLQFKGDQSPDVTFGGSLLLSEMGLSFAPDQLTTDPDKPDGAGNSSNPIASNLLGAGSDAVDASKENPPSNPTFSAQVSYINKLKVSLLSPDGDGTEILIPIQRAFGPLFVDSLGVGWDDQNESNPLLDFIFTGNVSLAGLTVSLIGLDIGIPVTNPTDFGAYNLDLAGLDISYNGGSVAIEAGLLKQKDPFLQYIGSAVLKASSFSIMALGAYAQVPDKHGKNVTSLFIFGSLSAPLGGVPAFFITGVAAGFGYNRSIKIPAINEIMDYPMVAGVLNGTLTQSNDPASALTKLADIVSPEIGQYWLAAGLKFSSFQLVETAAVLFVSFGNSLEFNLLGLSYASLPPKMSKDKALAYFELAIKVSFKPSDGIVSVEAQLTSNSFVLTNQCKVTGGFAFFLWYKNITQTIDGKQVPIPAGDFVISLGGYHPQFVPPAYYPQVPRLGFQWIIDVAVGKVSITGGAYFAITPTAIMAGGYLSVLFESGPLKAWLDAYANFIIEWKPFFFSVGIGITVGASFGTTVGGVSVTLKAELGAQLHLEGPPINGFVEVDWYVISFTIPIGNQETAKNDTVGGWDVFASSFLPLPVVAEPKTSAMQSKMNSKALKAEDNTPVQQIIKWNAESGLLNSNNNEENSEDALWVVSPMYYSFNVVSAVPSSEVTIAGTSYNETGIPVGIRPMDYESSLGSPIEVKVVNQNDTGVNIDLLARGFEPARQENGSPAALWSKDAIVPTQAPSSEGMIIASTLLGLSFTANRYVSTGSIPEFPIENLKYTNGTTKLLPFYYQITYPTPAKMNQSKPFTQIMNSIMSEEVIAARNSIYSSLANLKVTGKDGVDSNLNDSNAINIDAPLNPDLSVMKTSANLILQTFPIIAPVDIYQNGGQIIPPNRIYAARLEEVYEEEAHVPQRAIMEGSLRRYRTQPKMQDNLNEMAVSSQLPAMLNYVHSKWTDHAAMNKLRAQNDAPQLRTSVQTESHRVYNGGVNVWRVDPKVQNVLHLNGDLSVMVISFDKFYALLEMKLIVEEMEYNLPEGTGQVVIQAYDPEEHPTIGWQKNSLFTKINHFWSLGDGCLFRAQNAKRTAINRQDDRQGIVEINRLLSNNKVTGHEDETLQGWHQTVLKTGSPYIGVLVEGSDIDSIRASVAGNSVPAVLGASEPVEIRTVNNHTLLVYEATSDEPVSFVGVIVHSGNDAQRIAGVYSLEDHHKSRSAEDVWSQLSLKYNALDPADAKAARSTQVSFTI